MQHPFSSPSNLTPASPQLTALASVIERLGATAAQLAELHMRAEGIVGRAFGEGGKGANERATPPHAGGIGAVHQRLDEIGGYLSGLEALITRIESLA